jgi:hypothetical protein
MEFILNLTARRAGYPEVTHFVLPSGVGEKKSKENVDEGSACANATKEKAFVGLWNPGSLGYDDQTAATLAAAHHDDVHRDSPRVTQAKSKAFGVLLFGIWGASHSRCLRILVT